MLMNIYHLVLATSLLLPSCLSKIKPNSLWQLRADVDSALHEFGIEDFDETGLYEKYISS